jgi:hypothetical protein
MAEPRTGTERKLDSLAKLREVEADVWVATASSTDREYLVPLSYAWDGMHVILASEPGLATTRNIEASGLRVWALGPPATS